MNAQTRLKILIVDDSYMNRVFLTEMLSDRYEIEEAEDGEQAVEMLSSRGPVYSLILLDLIMPGMNGIQVLESIRNQKWIEDIPVIIISSETEKKWVKRAYELGVTDFIERPFDFDIVRQRVANTIQLYSRQQQMLGLVSEKLFESERQSSLMVAILSHIVEFRNGESGTHVLNITAITRLLLQKLMTMEQAEHYGIREDDIPVFSRAAALHDIGKISISDKILNKPGKLTDEEYEIMKTHAAKGAEILQKLGQFQEDPLIRAATDISHWHHERWDGSGYPDGLKGDEIPISAQVVSLADVYDALVSERCYKRAIPHDKAITMIVNGECGQFNPLLIQCLVQVSDKLQTLRRREDTLVMDYDNVSVERNVHQYDNMSAMEEMMQRIQASRIKIQFLANEIKEPVFEYYYEPSVFELSANAAKYLGLKETAMDPVHNEEVLKVTDQKYLLKGLELAEKTTPENPEFELEVFFHVNGKEHMTNVRCKTIWISYPPKRYGIVGHIISKEKIN